MICIAVVLGSCFCGEEPEDPGCGATFGGIFDSKRTPLR
jgi:hypothetical protein